jgi:hypothetical protein
MTINELKTLAADQGIMLDPVLLQEYPVGTWFWYVHHAEIAELLDSPLADRIEYILTKKHAHERAIRLAAFRPVLKPETVIAAVRAANHQRAAIQTALHVDFDASVEPTLAVYRETVEDNKELRKNDWNAFVTATKDSWAAYCEACESAEHVFAVKYDEAEQTYHRSLQPLWEAEYPNHPQATAAGLTFPKQEPN